MAHYEYVKSFKISRSVDVPYRYICGQCGREVTGVAELVAKNEAKASSRHADFSLKEEVRKEHEQSALYDLWAKVKLSRKAVGKGDFSMLQPYCKCPHCGAEQKWAYPKSSVVLFSLLTLGSAALVILAIVFYILHAHDENFDASVCWAALIPLFFGVFFCIRAVGDYKALCAAKGQATKKPEVFFDRMTSPWLDELKRIG